MSETFKPTESMASNAKRAIKWKEEGKANGAGTAVGWTRAGQLARRESLTLDTVKRMYSFFSRHEVDKKGKDWDKPSNGKIMWYAWGGDSGYSWSRAIVNRMKNEVKKDLVINLVDDLMDLTKSIGTSSSINEERDERSVENYVRTGGNIMENTTEPDPKGDIAVQKAYPDATNDAKNTIDQATRPEADAKVSDAPEGPVPTQETIPSSATSAIAPTSAEMAEPVEKGATCKECGQALPMKKTDDADEDDAKVEKAATCADCGEADCKCVDKAVDAESKETKEETPKPEMKKSLWGGAFAPVK